MEAYKKGYEYEKYVAEYIRRELNKNAYLWKHIPEKHLISSGLVHTHNQHRLNRKNKRDTGENLLIDVGVDILQVDNENKCSLLFFTTPI